ncbi:RING finger protein 150-like [Argonauta hians]
MPSPPGAGLPRRRRRPFLGGSSSSSSSTPQPWSPWPRRRHCLSCVVATLLLLSSADVGRCRADDRASLSFTYSHNSNNRNSHGINHNSEYSSHSNSNNNNAYLYPKASSDHKLKAVLKLQYTDSNSGQGRVETSHGMFWLGGAVKTVSGIVIHVRSGNNSFGCTTIDNPPHPSVRHWIALFMRGGCDLSDKIRVAAAFNASASVIYDEKTDAHFTITTSSRRHDTDVGSRVTVLINRKEGEKISTLLDNGTKLQMHIERLSPPTTLNISRTSILFVSISFIVLMIISLTWLIFYYIQRFRYAHAKERLTKRLANAAKKTIAKIPQRTIKSGDKELESDYDQCAVCIEGYKPSDVIRILPCKHILHKSCVDPWLLEQRSCPMCKMDILRAYGMPVNGSQESVNQAVEVESVTTSGGMIEDNDHDSGRNRTLEESVVHLQSSSAHFCTSPIEVEGECSLEASERLMEPSPSLGPACSMESIHSLDSDCNEFQSLMIKPKKTSSTSATCSNNLSHNSIP